MGKAVSLHPLAVLLGVAAFSFLFGIVGALFAVPVLAVTNTVMLYWTGHDKFPMLQHGHSAVSSSAKHLVAQADRDPEPGAKGARKINPKIGDVSPVTLREKAEDDTARAHENALDRSDAQSQGRRRGTAARSADD